MIVHETQRFMAERMHAKVRSHPVDHAPLVSAPSVVVDIIPQVDREPSRRAANTRAEIRPAEE
jgi:hypothetical protein